MSIIEAARLFVETSLRGFPVMDNQRIVGQLNRSDLLKALIRLSRDIAGKPARS
jgi:predicted transcriptional regulator